MDVARVFDTVYLRLMITHVSGRARSRGGKKDYCAQHLDEGEGDGKTYAEFRTFSMPGTACSLHNTNLNGTNWTLTGDNYKNERL
jgi:hypothetical protein